MKVKKFNKGLVITIGLGAVLLWTSAHAATCGLAAPGIVAYSDFAGGRAPVTAPHQSAGDKERCKHERQHDGGPIEVHKR